MHRKNNLQKIFKSQTFSIITLLICLISFFYINTIQGSISISERRFEKMMLDNDIEEVALITNQNLVEITLKPASCLKDVYKAELATRLFVKIDQAPHYKFRIPSVDIFNANFKAIEEKLPLEEHIGYVAKHRTDVSSMLINWGMFLLVLLGFYVGGVK